MELIKTRKFDFENNGIKHGNKVLKRKINLLEFLASFSVFAMIVSIFTVTSMPITNITLVVFVSIYIISKKKIHLADPYYIWSCLILILFTLSYGIFSNNHNAFEVYFTYARTIIVGAFIYGYIITNPKNLNKVIVFCTLSGIYIMIKFFFENDITSLSFFNATVSQSYTIEGINRNSVAITLSITALFLWHWAKSGKKWCYFLVAIAIVEALLTGSRKSILWLAGGLALYIFLDGWINTKKIKLNLRLFGSIILTFLMLGSFYFLIIEIPIFYEILGQRIEGLIFLFSGQGIPEMSAQIRQNMNQIAWSMFLDRPLFGGGFNFFATYSGWGSYSHNNYMETLVSFGAIGLVLYYSIHVYLIRNFLKRRNMLINSLSSNIYLIGFVSIFLICITDIAMVSTDTKQFTVLLAIGAAVLRISFDNHRKKVAENKKEKYAGMCLEGYHVEQNKNAH